MPGMTKESALREKKNKLKYSIRITDFVQKMKTWPFGREVQSVPFMLGEAEFYIAVFPNGKDIERTGHVSVYVQNTSQWDVTIEMKFEIGRREDGGTHEILSKNGFGYPWIYDHKSLKHDNDAFDEDGTLEVVVFLSLVWEEVTEERKDVKDLLKENKVEVNVLKKKIETLSAKVDSTTGLMLNMEKSLTSKIQALEISSKKCSLPCPECPICFEEMKPPVRIVQCRSGHLLCQQCRDRPQVTSCPTC
eukprot:GFUD01030376.1.p1 GENE.GFUD01030376.1~~GFUD01030376.1.p1  ORF type:complete len:248 (+),score=63.89 GFUD01030376.1:55-798(+)